ncbi:gamma-tubulin complex component GCP6 [Cordyceps fumosorosea ARSEF 2679]|uniref:Gamma-tubulin complex component GCP6 n=1 Tax=Cordyceps fumosorosea (strain ARSEF 2679) TaxID=1081104 RepID=A0A167UBQ1_CORFA|nr:gamma-tubulin complex component GCP6 [Cordyceps fumosorosea ARSEF 2679]OAA61425.1 gamma-tubulin complex component GCP6 [Cordyceps fumosorosea ARSEF 2679]
MAGEGTEANLFAVPDFWQKSKWLQDLATDPKADFFSLHKNDVPQNKDDGSFAAVGPIFADPNRLFKPPVFDASNSPEPEPSVDEMSTASEPIPDPTSEESDTWMDLDEPAVTPPTHRTWDAFEAGTTVPHEPLFLSEAGASTYDALLSLPTDPLRLRNSDVPVVETKAYFSALLTLALGQQSLLFIRNRPGKTFRPALPKFRISGYSRQVLAGVEEECLACGMRMLDLRSFIQASYTGGASPCRIALASAISRILQVVHKYVTVDKAQPPSLLQLQASIACLAAIVKPLVRLNAQLRSNMRDHDILSAVFHHASLADAESLFIRDMMREILQRVSMPWIEFLQEWVGTRVEQDIPISKSDLGARKWFVKVDKEIYVDDFGRQVEDIDFRLDRSRVPSFLPNDVAQSIFETGKNLRFIRSHHPEHVLASTQFTVSQKPPEIKWLFDWNTISSLERGIKSFRERMLTAVNDYRRGNSPQIGLIAQGFPQESQEYELIFYGVDEQEMENRIQASMQRLQEPLRDETAGDSLSTIVRRQLDQGYSDSSRSGLTPHWSLLPLLSFGALVSAQARSINQEHMRLLFIEHDLAGHLRLYREFHMLGSGLFCTRLSQALFNPNLESAERQAGIARQGGVMGLRLGGRDTWPPASSELRLALMGILSDAYLDRRPKSLNKLDRDGDKLPGDFSFAVRDLSEEEIEKCMDPNSLEALDFLCLQYTTPPALSSVITPVVLLQYDRIFRLLLRVLRMMYVVDELFRQTLWASRVYGYELSEEEYRFVREARVFVSSVAGYFLDIAVSIPWQAFESRLQQMQAALELSRSDTVTKQPPSPLQLQQLHSSLLYAIMSGLFLRKRQQPILNLLEDIFNGILEYAKAAKARDSAAAAQSQAEETKPPSELYREFKQKVQIFISVCRSISEKAKSEPKSKDGGDGLFASAGIEKHAARFYEITKDHDDMYTYTDNGPYHSLPHIIDTFFIPTFFSGSNARRSFPYAVIDKTRPPSTEDPSGELAGLFSYEHADAETLCVEIGHVRVAPGYQRRGVAVAAAALMVRHALDGLGLARVGWGASSVNEASVAVAQRVGFGMVGTVPFQRVLRDGKARGKVGNGRGALPGAREGDVWRDVLMFCITWEEWEAGKRDHVLGLLGDGLDGDA